MSQKYSYLRAVFSAPLGAILLALAGCVSMPTDWPATRPLATVSGLEGTYRGELKQCAQFTIPLFGTQYSSAQGADGIRLTTVPDGLQVEALSGPTVLHTRVVPVELADGAVTFKWKGSGAGQFRETLRVNAAGELVIEHHQFSVGIDAYSDTKWWRMPRVVQ